MIKIQKMERCLCALLSMALCTGLLFGCAEEDVFSEIEPTEIVTSESAVPTVNKTYFIKSRKSGKYADVAAYSHSNGGKIHQWAKHGGLNQQWEVLSVGSGYYRLKSKESGKSFDITGKSTANRAYLQQWAYGGGTNQQFTFHSAGSGYYMIKARHSGKALDGTGQTGNGSRIWQWTYNTSNQNQHWLFEEVGGSTTPPTSGSAQDILGGLTNWKLNAYSGSLNVSSSNNGLSYVDNASKSDNSNWFYGSNGFAYFKCYPGNPTSSSGTSNPRTELRQMTSNGSTEIHWDGTTSTEHSMKWTVRVDDLPPSGKLCFGQIHSISGSSFDDIIRIQVEGSSGQNSGSVTLRILGYATEDLLGSGQSISSFNFNMDTAYSFELAMKNKIVKLYALNSSGSRTSTLFTSGSIDSDENYFKAGCYLQSTSSSHSSSSTYGLVGISSLTVSP